MIKKVFEASVIGAIVMGIITFIPPIFTGGKTIFDMGTAFGKYENRLEEVEYIADKNKDNVEASLDLLCAISIELIPNKETVKKNCKRNRAQ